MRSPFPVLFFIPGNGFRKLTSIAAELVVPFIKMGCMKVLASVIMVLSFGWASAQTTENTGSNNDPPIYNDVSGTPYVIRDWSEGVIRFSSGRVTDQFKIKFDCITNHLMLQFKGSSFATESKVREFVMYSKSGAGKDSMVFRKGFPVTKKANEETFYQVLAEGKTMLLLLHIKQITEEQQIASKVIYRRIRDEQEYYLLKDGAMAVLPTDKSSIIQTLNDQSEKIQQFINEHQIKFRNAEDFRKLIVYYNSLL